MAFRGRDASRFSDAESFMLYVEGLRALQLHEAEANRKDGGSKSWEALRDTLEEAARYFGECVGKYPKDLLPRYYHAITLTIQGQAEQARQLRHELTSPEEKRDPAAPAESYYKRAAEQFKQTAANAQRELRMYARYNEAQALSNQAAVVAAVGLEASLPFLEEARAILADLAVDARGRLGQTTSSVRSRISVSLDYAVRPVRRSASALDQRIGHLKGATWLIWILSSVARLVEGLQGVFAPAARPAGEASLRSGLEPEGKALVWQVELLRAFIALWERAIADGLGVGMFPGGSAAWSGSEPPEVERLKRLIDTIVTATLPAPAREDLQAEYWNKWARLARTLAQNSHDWGERAALLDLAAGYYTFHLTELKRDTWTPAVLNYAFVLALQGQPDAAKKKLELILGARNAPAEPLPPPAAKPDVEAIKKYILDMRLGTPASTVTSLLNSAYGPFEPATVQELVRALDHAGVEMQFIEQIITGLDRSPLRSSPRLTAGTDPIVRPDTATETS